MNFKIFVPILKIVNKNKITKYCINCRYCVPEINGTRCNRRAQQSRRIDPITGNIHYNVLQTDAKQERETSWPFSYLNGTCGKSARLYKSKLCSLK